MPRGCWRPGWRSVGSSGFDRALLTCLPDNEPSMRVIIANGGVQDHTGGGDEARFWIDPA